MSLIKARAGFLQNIAQQMSKADHSGSVDAIYSQYTDKVHIKLMLLVMLGTLSSGALAQVDSDSDGIPDASENQCIAELAVMSEEVEDGTLTANFVYPDGTTGRFIATAPTTGSFNANRPAYNSDGEYALTLRGGGSGASTTIEFDAPLGVESEFLIADVNKLEDQQIIAYVGAEPHYPVAIKLGNGAQLTGDNNEILIDSDGDDTFFAQAYLRFRFAVAIDKLVVTSVDSSDVISISLPQGCTQDVDLDGDNVLNRDDADSDGDSVSDAIEGYDSDHDGVAGPGSSPDELIDTDGDEWPDFLDTDDDGDGLLTGIGDAIVADLDSDGKPDYLDISDNRINSDDDDLVDVLDDDDDADGIPDSVEGDGQVDTDGDATPDSLDADADGDQIPDLVEGHDADGDGLADVTPSGQDNNNNGLDDAFDGEVDGGVVAPLPNTDLIGYANFQDADDDEDGILTENELLDSDDDGTVPDYLEALDSDGDNTTDMLDLDDDADTILDLFEGSVNTDDDDLLDRLDADSDGDSLSDISEVGGSCVIGRSWLDVSTIDDDDESSNSDSWVLAWTGATDIATTLSVSMAINPDEEANWAGIIQNDTDDFWASQASAYFSIAGATGPVYQLNIGDSQADEASPIVADYQFASALPAQTYLLVEDVDTAGEYVQFLGDNGPTSPLMQIPRLDMAAYAGAPLHFPSWDVATQRLDDGAEGIGSSNEVTIFDVSGLSRLQIESGRSTTGGVFYALVNFENTCLTENDTDGDQTADFQDIDDDGDSVHTAYEGAPAQNTDNDALPDYLDNDDDGDSLLTINETPDQNGDGNPDDALNSDSAGLPDYLQVADDVADLSVTKTGFPDTQLVGEPVFFSIKVTNHGPEDATGVVVHDLIPDGYTLDFQSVGDAYNAATGIWAVGDLTSGSDDSILFRVVVNELGERTNIASVSSDLADTNAENNSDNFTVSVATDPSNTNTDNDEVSDIDDFDDDNDGILDTLEQAMASNNGDTDGDQVPDELDLDSDGDLIPDLVEAGHGEADSNGDFMIDSPVGTNGYADALESTPGVSNYALADTDLDGLKNFQDSDDDNDGLLSFYEGGVNQNSDGTGLADYLDDDDDDDGIGTGLENSDPNNDGNPEDAVDTDGDEIPDYLDAFGVDSDGDQIADENDDDDDNDGILDILESATAQNGGDTDGDNTPDSLDLDSDEDGLFDLLEAAHAAVDADENGRVDGEVGDNGYLDSLEQGVDTGTPNYFLANSDSDNLLDFQDVDDDGDSIDTKYESAPAQNTDDDALPDYLDDDDDNDDALTIDESPDQNNDGNPEDALDTDGDEIPDYLDDLGFDLDGDQVQDSDDLDDDNDGIPDTLEDATALNGGDTDGDETPDSQDLDSDGDSLSDVVEAGHADGNVDGAGYLQGEVGSNGLLDSLETAADSDEINYELLNTDNAGLPNFQTLDEDGDGLFNQFEGVPDQDSDSDDIPDYLDADDDADDILTLDENADPNVDNNPADAQDSDGDQIPDYLDNASEDHDGDNIIDTLDLDDDNDGILDSLELENALNNGDTDQDQIPDVYDLDSDGDNLPDYIEAGHGAADADADLRVDGEVGENGYLDALETVADSDNPNYFVRNTDSDSLPDFQDSDDDNDGLLTAHEAAPAQNTDNDELPDYLDADDDGDDLATADENADPNADGDPADAQDSDLDSVPDYLDDLNDTDGDQISDADDLDDDNDGLLDSLEQSTALNGGDTDLDGIADWQDLDSDGDQLPDHLEAGHGAAVGADLRVTGELGSNGYLDSLETAADSDTPNYFPLDSDTDNLPDYQDVDDDNDGLLTEYEQAPDLNTDSDGLPNYRDADDDGDEILTINENADPNEDGNPADALNSDDDEIPDYLDQADIVIAADIKTTLAASATELNEGDEIFLNIVVSNLGGDDATGVTMQLTLPAGFEYRSNTAGESFDMDTGLWTIANLNADDELPVLVRVEAVAGGVFTVTANSSADQSDSDTSNNLASSEFTIIGSDDLDGDLIPDDDDIDDDNDGWPDEFEQATALNDGDSDGDQIPDSRDLDSDGDGIWDYLELGHGEEDTDGDHRVDGEVGSNGLLDALETGNNNGFTNYIPPDSDDDNVFDFQDADDELDSDGDNIIDEIDIDDDNDGIPDDIEIALVQAGGDGDTDNIAAELDLDSDGDQLPDYVEAGHGLTDATDGRLNGEVGENGYLDVLETNGNGAPNFTYFDHDFDAKFNFQDKDDDNDGLFTEFEGAPNQNTDSDDEPDYLDADDDGDGLPTANENADQNNDGDPADALITEGDTPDYLSVAVGGTDTDGDNVADAIDADSDNDGIPDAVEDAASLIFTGDTDGDNTPDRLDLDSDGDGVFDVVEAGHGIAANAENRLDGEYGSNGFLDAIEFFVNGTETDTPNYSLTDTDNDATFNYVDRDDDGDGLFSDFEGAPAQNTDNDDLPDYLDDDDDDDDLLTIDENADPDGNHIPEDNAQDSDGDDIPDYLDDTVDSAIDTDGDQVADEDDFDDDNDGILDTVEDATALNSGDTDQDNLVDRLDSDSDGDNVLDVVEAGHGLAHENGRLIGSVGDNGLLDALENAENGIVNYTLLNTDSVDLPDFQDVDDDNDSIHTQFEGATDQDTDDDNLPDYLDNDDDGDNILTINENPDPDQNGNPEDAQDTDNNDVADYLEAPQAQEVLLSLKVFLQGPMEADVFTSEVTDSLMRDDLRNKGLLPLNEPYSNLDDFIHVGGGGQEVAAASSFNVSGSNAIVDWVFVELRSDADQSQVLATRSALLQRDGDVVDVDGISPLQFVDRAAGDYKVAVRHRNHLGVMKLASVTLSASPTVIDFTTMDDANLFHNVANHRAQIELGAGHSGILGKGYGDGAGKQAMWAGNTKLSVDTIEFISQQGGNNDRDQIYLDVINAEANTTGAVNYILTDYSRSDTNLDGEVRAQGVGVDSQMAFVNLLSHPNNPSFSFNFVATEQLP